MWIVSTCVYMWIVSTYISVCLSPWYACRASQRNDLNRNQSPCRHVSNDTPPIAHFVVRQFVSGPPRYRHELSHDYVGDGWRVTFRKDFGANTWLCAVVLCLLRCRLHLLCQSLSPVVSKCLMFVSKCLMQNNHFIVGVVSCRVLVSCVGVVCWCRVLVSCVGVVCWCGVISTSRVVSSLLLKSD